MMRPFARVSSSIVVKYSAKASAECRFCDVRVDGIASAQQFLKLRIRRRHPFENQMLRRQVAAESGDAIHRNLVAQQQMVQHRKHHHRVEVACAAAQKGGAFAVLPSVSWRRMSEIDTQRQNFLPLSFRLAHSRSTACTSVSIETTSAPASAARLEYTPVLQPTSSTAQASTPPAPHAQSLVCARGPRHCSGLRSRRSPTRSTSGACGVTLRICDSRPFSVFRRICLASSGSLTGRDVKLSVLHLLAARQQRRQRNRRECRLPQTLPATRARSRYPPARNRRGASATSAAAIPAASRQASAEETSAQTAHTQARSADADPFARSRAHRQRSARCPETAHSAAWRPSAASHAEPDRCTDSK